MKPVLIQNMVRRRRKEVIKSEPVGQEIEQAANTVVRILFVILAVLIIGSIAIA